MTLILIAAELESQVSDLIEANEAAQVNLNEKQAKVQSLQSSYDHRIKELERENSDLRYTVNILDTGLIQCFVI